MVVITLPVLFELDFLTRISRGGIRYRNKARREIKGRGLLRYFEKEKNINIFEDLDASDVIRITNLRMAESLPGKASRDYFDCAISFLAMRYNCRLITCDQCLQADKRIKTGW